jgi:hypothetical protein
MVQNKTIQNRVILFTAASFDPRLKLGAGAKLVLSTVDCQASFVAEKFKALPIATKNFEDATPTRLELETVIWALQAFRFETKGATATLCCDFKSTQGLLEKRERLEKSNYEGIRPGSTVINADLFIDFYKQHDRLHFEILPIETLEPDNPLRLILKEVAGRSLTALKEKLKAENKVADKWF